MGDATTTLFGLPGLRVAGVLRVDGEGELVELPGVGTRRVVLAETDLDRVPVAACCPVCRTPSRSVKARRTTRPRDVGHGPEPVDVRWRKTQYRCRVVTCRRRVFTEALPQIPARARLTERLRGQVGASVNDEVSVAGAAAAGGVSWPVAHAAHARHADRVLAAADADPDAGPRVLGIDETRRGRPRWERDDDGTWRVTERFETNFVDLGDGHGCGSAPLLGQAAGRTSAAVTGWINARSQLWRAGVQVVAIDPSAAYRAAVQTALPGATIVADHFHLVRLANEMVTDVRQRVTRTERGRRGRKTDPEWARRRRLLRGYERLTAQQFARMWNDLADGDPTGQIITAYIVKEELRRLLAVARCGGVRTDIAHHLHRFYQWAANSGLPEAERLAETVTAWWPQIEAFLRLNITNAGTESVNRQIKTQGRLARGFRNLPNQRRRVRFACLPRSRRATVTRQMPPQI